MIASQPGLLPENVLEDLIEKARGLEMDELRKEMENTEKEEEDRS